MRKLALISTMALGLGCSVFAIDNGNVKPIAVNPIPVSQWQVVNGSGDKVALSNDDGVLQVTYDVDVNAEHQIGHKTLKQVSFKILLRRPIAMSEDYRRVVFEAEGLDAEDKNHNRRIYIYPIIKDQSGELLKYMPTKYPHLRSGGKTWSKWMSTDFFAGEAGGATQDVFEAEGGDKNAWPDGKLEFAGFEVNVRRPEFGRRKGTVRIGDIEIAGIGISLPTPYAYADSFFNEAGKYRLAFCVRNDFQALPISESEKEFVFDPKSSKSRKQLLAIPLGPIDNYWIDYQITSQDSKVLAADSMRYQVTANPEVKQVKPVDPATEPVLGYFRINAERKSNGVYSPAEPMNVTVRIFPKGKQQLEFSWYLTPYRYVNKLQQGKQTVSFDNGKYQDIVIKLKRQDQRSAGKLHIDLTDKGKTLDSQIYVVGTKPEKLLPHSREGSLANRHEIKKSTYYRTSFLPKRKGPETEIEGISFFREFLSRTKQTASNVTYMVDLANFEVLPGVYDFHFLDQVMDAAADYGCKITVRLAHADQNGLYTWPKYSRQHNYDGTEIDQHYYGAYAVTDPRTTKLWLDAYRALYDRYSEHTAFQGYYVMQPGGEWTVMDKPWKGMIAGYSDAAAEGFRTYLQKNKGLTLPALNKRWGTAYKAWNDVKPPMPLVKDGAKPDLRMQWLDFSLFKGKMAYDVWFPLAIDSIRAYDPDRITIIYAPPNKCKKLYNKLDYCHNGGNHYGTNLGQFISAWEKGKIGWITEPHHPHRWAAYGDLADRGWVLDWSVWVMTAQAGAGGANLHVYYIPNPTLSLPKHYGGEYSLDRFEKFRPTLEEFMTIKVLEESSEVAVLQDEYTLYCKHRTTFKARLEDLKRWFALLEQDSIAFENYTSEHEKNYKLLLPNVLDEVMSKENADSFNRLVRNGAKMVMAANTGKYIPEEGTDTFQFLKKLGITPPKGNYVQSKKNVTARVTDDNPLFGKGDSIGFFSLADLQSDLKSDTIKKAFWSYPYRWIPQTDYFGYYPENKETNGTVLARFADGGVALSKHQVGKGEVIVFWGTPDLRGDKLKGMMAKAAKWADAISPRRGSPIPRTIEAHSDSLGRHYGLFFQDKPGTYTQKIPTTPDGNWFLDDMVSGQRLGTYTGKELREKGLTMTFVDGYSPLKAIRMMPAKELRAKWVKNYRQP